MPDNVDIAITPNGDVFLLETGGRIVRTGNALNGDRTAEVIYIGKERLDAMCATEDGALHAVGARYHTNTGGTWRKEKIGRTDAASTSTAVWADGRGNVVAGDRGEILHRHADGTWTSIPFGPQNIRLRNVVHALGGQSLEDLWAVGGGAAHFDGTSWTPITPPGLGLYLDICARDDHALIVGRNEGYLFAARGGTLETLLHDPKLAFFGVAATPDVVYLATGGPLYAWDGKELRRVIDRAGWKVATLGNIVATGGYREPSPGAKAEGGTLVLIEGEWQFWPSPPKDAKPAEEPKEPKKTAAKKKKAASPKL